MKRLGLVCAVLMAVMMLAGQGYATPPAPANGTWLYLTKLQADDSGGGGGWSSPLLYGVWFDSSWGIDCTTWTAFAPAITSDFPGTNVGGAGSFRPGAYVGAPQVLTAPTPTSHAELLMGVYYNDSPASSIGRQTMDVAKLQLSNAGVLTQTNVYDGAAWVNGTTWHTEDMSAVYYSAGNQLTGTAKGLLVSKGYTAGSSTVTPYHATGSIADTNSNGSWDDETGVYTNRGNCQTAGVVAGPSLFSAFQAGGYSNIGGYSNGINQSRRLTSGAILNNVYYSGSLPVIMSPTAGGIAYPPPRSRAIAAGDVGHDGTLDVFFATQTLDDLGQTVNAVAWARDLNGDNDALDLGETTVLYKFPHGSADIYEYSVHVEGLVEGASGWTVLAATFSHVNNGPYFVNAIDVADPTNVKTIMSSPGDGNGNPTTQYGWRLYNFETYVGVEAGGPVIPEPGTLLLIGTGAIGLIGYLRRRRMS